MYFDFQEGVQTGPETVLYDVPISWATVLSAGKVPLRRAVQPTSDVRLDSDYLPPLRPKLDSRSVTRSLPGRCESTPRSRCPVSLEGQVGPRGTPGFDLSLSP